MQGDSSLQKTQVSIKSMVRNFKEGDQGVMLELRSLSLEDEGKGIKLIDEMTELLQRHCRVFDWPNELSPVHSHDHAIVLQIGAKSMNVRPY